MAESHRKSRISRRNFARGVAFVATAAAVPGPIEDKASGSSLGQTTSQTKSAETECRFQSILQKYGDRFSDEEKSDIKRLLGQAQKTGETLRVFPLENSDEPATVFRVYRPKPNVERATPPSTRRRSK